MVIKSENCKSRDIRYLYFCFKSNEFVEKTLEL